MRILFLATHQVRCGIATYTQQLRDHLSAESSVCSLPERVNHQLLDTSITSFINRAVEYDVVHIQHEHGLFTGDGDESDAIERLGDMLKQLSKTNKPVFVTFHSDPVFYTDKKVWSGEGMLRSLLSGMWRKQVSRWFQPKYNVHAIVHTNRTKQEFVQSQFSKHNTHVIPHGVINRDITHKPIDLNGDVNLSIFGFISSYKGYNVALHALELLPKKYKLVCMGGRHPTSEGDEYTDILRRAYDIDKGILENKLNKFGHHKVRDRVTITGYLDDTQADQWHEKTDICLAPYTDKTLSGSGALTWSITSGRPTIASDIPSFKSINKQYGCMHLFKTDAHFELAWAIRHVAENEHVQQNILSGAKRYTDQLSWSNVADMHVDLYQTKIK